MDYVHGIGNEVLCLFAGLAIFLPCSAYYVWKKWTSNVGFTYTIDENEEALISSQPVYNLRCPVCLGHPTFKISTNCGHAYCGTCILELSQHSTSIGSVSCAMCRSKITWVIEQFTDAEKANRTEDALKLKYSIQHLKNYLSFHSRTLIDQLRDFPNLFYFMIDELTRLNGLLPLASKLKLFFIFLLVLIYLIIPYDLVPEVVFGYLGLLDDVLAALVLFMYASEMFRYFITVRQF